MKTVTEFCKTTVLPPAYHEHPAVVAAKLADPEAVTAPLCLYMDAVPYSQTDGVLGVWIECMATSAHWLCGVIRRRNICRCGCKGWCSYYPLFSTLLWSIRCLSLGVFPDTRHDNSDWRRSDESRSVSAGERFSMNGAIVYI